MQHEERRRRSKDDKAFNNNAFEMDFIDYGGRKQKKDAVSTEAQNPHEEEEETRNKVDELHKKAVNWINKHRKKFYVLVGLVTLLLYHAYFAYAMYWKHNAALIAVTVLGWFMGLWYLVFKPYVLPHIQKTINRIESGVRRVFKWWVVLAIQLMFVAAFVVFVLWDSQNDWFKLVPFSGLAVYVILLWLMSSHPGKVNWRPVIYGMAMQVVMGLMVLRWSVGFAAINFLSEQVTVFLGYVKNGTSFVYGFVADPPPDLGVSPVFLFSVLSTVIYFSSFVSALYYLGIMQWIIMRIGWVFQICLKTTAAESLCCAGNIFLGQTESPLLVKPYLHKLTRSEIHAIMTSGFATIAGSVFGAYISFGACPVHLLTACVMSAPAALACSKLICPEVEETQTNGVGDMQMDSTEDANVLDAISRGASAGIQLVLNIGANLIVFLAFLALFDQIIDWLGSQVGVEGLSFERICSYIFFPLAYMMGSSDLKDVAARNREVLKVSELMGVKTFLNEFIAYQRMGRMIHCCILSPRAQLVATYALCGFSNIGSLGVLIGGLSSLCPEKRSVIAQNGVRAMVAGSIACFMTACWAGILTSDLAACAIPRNIFDNVNCTLEFGQGCANVTY